MNHQREPRRLLSRARNDSALGVALLAARARGPSAAEQQALADSLSVALGNVMGDAPSAGGELAAPGRGAWGGRALVAKFGALSLAIGLVSLVSIGVRWVQHQRTQAPTTAASASSPRSALSAAPAELESGSARPQETRPFELPCANPPCVRAEELTQRAVRQRAAKRVSSGAPSELQLIDQARQALRSSPSDAISLCNEHERRFPRGSMSEEREVIRIDALVGLGQTRRAQALAREFLRANGGSAYARRVEAALSPVP